MNELSLFSGAGGGLLASKLLGWRTVGYVEFNDYCQRVIAQRIKDGFLDEAPIFGDVRTFLSEGYAASYTGMVDVVSGGFPCQPFSLAGKRAGAGDARNMWPATIDVIRAVKPRLCFLENVRGLLSSGYFEQILKDLAGSGYDARWRLLSAAEVGAPHKRDRLWIVAHANGQHGVGWGESQQPISQGRETWNQSSGSGQDVAHAQSEQSRRPQQPQLSPDVGASGQVRHAAEQGLPNGRSASLGEPQSQPQPQRPSWWQAEPDVGRLADGIPNRVDRLRAAGNGQVPAVAAAAWEILTEGWR